MFLFSAAVQIVFVYFILREDKATDMDSLFLFPVDMDEDAN